MKKTINVTLAITVDTILDGVDNIIDNIDFGIEANSENVEVEKHEVIDFFGVC